MAISRVLKMKVELISSRLVQLGTMFFYQRRFVDAAGQPERAAALGAGTGRLRDLGNLAECYRQLPGRDAEARTSLAKAVGLAESRKQERAADPALRSRLAFYYALAGAARRRWPRSARLTPGAAGCRDVASAVRVYELVGQREEALAAFSEASARTRPPV